MPRQRETVINLDVYKATHRQAEAVGQSLIDKTLSLLLIKVVLANCTVEVVATSPIDAQAYPTDDFQSLYHARWNIEEAFKLLNYLEQFIGELPASIRQDFHA